MIKVLKTIIKGKTKKVVKMSKGDCFLRRHLILSRQRATRASYNNEGYLECCWILSGVCLSFFRYVSMSACLLVSQSIKGCFQGTPLAKGYVWEGKGGGDQSRLIVNMWLICLSLLMLHIVDCDTVTWKDSLLGQAWQKSSAWHIGCLAAWPCKCKQTSSLRSPINDINFLWFHKKEKNNAISDFLKNALKSGYVDHEFLISLRLMEEEGKENNK